MEIYTKSGDKGTSALFTGDRFDKNDRIFDCLGSIDELNAHLGLVIIKESLIFQLGKRILRRN